ncbi:MAG: pyruvate carboxylase [Burkholderiaceae bacterium]
MPKNMKKIRSILVANRSEISIRVMRAAAELGIRTVAIYSHEDRFALHRFKADESYQVGKGKNPLQAYLDIDDVIRIAREAGVDAIHPGYGFLSENPDFAQACADNGIAFIGPKPEVMTALGNKVSARIAAEQAGVPVMPATDPLPADMSRCKEMAAAVGYPLMLKASWGGGGRGMRVIENEADLSDQIDAARREAAAAFGNDEVYLEKLVRNARHVEVQILGDTHGELIHLFERDCSVQRRNQKVVERAPAPYLDDATRAGLCESALKLGRAVAYSHAGTVEFLMDADTGKYYFIEVNPRIQVEHTVTEAVTGIDIVKAQIAVTEGARIGASDGQIPAQANIRINGHALQCRVTTEDPENNFTPDYGRVQAYRSAAGFGVRLDAGTAYTGALITPYYDSLLVKVTAWAPTAAEAIARMDRCLREFRIRGVSSNLQFVENVINHKDFRAGVVTTRFIDQTPALFKFSKRRDRAQRLLRYIGDVTVNGHPDVKGRAKPDLEHIHLPLPDGVDMSALPPPGTKTLLDEIGPVRFSAWMLEQKRTLLTDTSMRDAHQSLFATRMRTIDMARIAPYYARLLPGMFSMECWGGATFDVAMRFLNEDPWDRLRVLRAAVPNVLLQMLLRSSNAVGYTNYADNVVKYFVEQAAKEGVDLFRVFDSLNWVDNMRVAIDAVLDSGRLCEGAICYTADIFDTTRSKYSLNYYVDIAKQLQKSGVHIIGVKDMAGVCRPKAAELLVRTLKEETGLPVHFHTHDTSGISAASVLAAISGGADAVDGAMDALSGLTSQPNLNSITQALAGSERDPTTTDGSQPSGVDVDSMREIARYWEGVRGLYVAFESSIRSGTADVYRHEMPGGQYTNLREQARATGLERRWNDVAKAYADVNQMFGDIVKVTPTSKVVGDLAIFMVANDLTASDVTDPEREITFPESVISLFKGELGFPPDGFPPELSRKILKAEPPVKYRPGDEIPAVDMNQARLDAEKAAGRKLSDAELASYLMYPKVFKDFCSHQRQFGDVSALPTETFYYGMREGEEIAVNLEEGKTLAIRMQGTGSSAEDPLERVFFELNGQPRSMRIEKDGVAKAEQRPQADPDNPNHVAAPMPGLVVTASVKSGQQVKAGDPLVSLEAMKMETQIRSERDGKIKSILVKAGETVAAHDLLVEFAN